MTIRTKIILVLAVFAVAPSMALGAWMYQHELDSLKAVRLAQLDSIATMKKDRIELYFKERRDDTLSAASLFTVRVELQVLARHAADLSHPDARAATAALDRELKPIQGIWAYLDILLTDTAGTVVYSSNEAHRAAHLGRVVDDARLLDETSRGFAYSEVGVTRAAGDDRIVITAAAPVRDLQETYIGRVMLVIDLGGTAELLTDRTGLGASGEVVIAKRDGNTALFLFPTRSSPAAALTLHVPLRGDGATAIELAVRGQSGSGIRRDYRDLEVIAAWRHLPMLDWGLVSKIDTAEAFAPSVRFRNLIAIIGAIIAIGGALAAFFAARSITDPLRRLQRDTEIIGGGKLEHDISTDEENEIGQFSRTLARMTRLLREKITEQERTAGELEKRLRELEEINRELNDFAHVVSHDLKAPLRAIASLSTLIAHDHRDCLDAGGKAQLDMLMNRVRRMDKLIEGILAYSRIGRVREEQVDVDLNEVIAHAVESVSPPGHIRVTVENRLPVVHADRTQVLQVFQNLVGNAVKFMDKPDGRVTVGCAEVDGFHQCHVADNGPGIEPQHHDRVFKIFQTLKSRDELESTGIGLAVVKKIVETKGGRVWIDSEPGKGAAFYFTFRKKVR